jgi:hypothetical protein
MMIPKGARGNITWDSINAGTGVKIEVTIDAWTTRQTVASYAYNKEGRNTYPVTVPAVNSNRCYLQITSRSNPAIKAVAGPFTIGTP